MILALCLSTAALTCGRPRSCQARTGRLVSSTCGQTLMTAVRVMRAKLTSDLSWETNFQLAFSLMPLPINSFAPQETSE